MRISGVQKFSMIDFNDKLCAVIFTQGCNLQCPYCHNPELVPMLSNKPLIPTDDILDFLRSRMGKLDAVAITGGEPLLQKNLIPFLQEIKHMGYLIKIDTNGLLYHKLSQIIESGLLDYLAMDIKASLLSYEKVVKVKIDESSLLKSIELIKNSGIEHEFRTTVVEGLITEADIYDIGDLVGKSNYFIQNFTKSHHLDEAYENQIGFSKEKLKRITLNLQSKGIRVNLRS